MSHTVKAETLVKDTALLRQVCMVQGLPEPEDGEHRLFDGKVVNGTAVKLPGWQYPVVFDAESGEAFYDNYRGSWGKQEELDKLLVGYAHDYVAQEFSRQGGSNVNEYVDADGWLVMEAEINAGQM